MARGRPGGNPDFGSKYKFETMGKKPLSEQVKVQIYSETKESLIELAKLKECSVPQLIREAIEEYLAKQKKIDAKTGRSLKNKDT